MTEIPHIFHHNGADIYVATWGDKDARPLVCVHGLTGSSADFKFVGEALSQKGFYVVAPDVVGRGKSSFLKDPNNYSYERYVDDLTALINYFSFSSVDWLGVSMGGLLGIALAGTEQSFIKNLILSDVGPEVSQISLDIIADYLDRSPVFTSMDEAVAAFKQSMNTPFDRGIRDEDLWYYYTKTHIKLNSDGVYERSFDDNIRHKFRTEPLGGKDLWQSWKNITQPVLELRGEWSLLYTQDIFEKMKLQKPNNDLELVTIKNCGHVPSLYVPDEINIIANWLAVKHAQA